MNSELPFQIALAGIVLLTASVGLYHRIQAASSRERLSHREEGYVFATMLRLAGALVWISVLAYMIRPSWLEWAAFSLPVWVRWMGVVGGVLSAGLVYWTLNCLGKNLTDTVVTRADAYLVTHGPYGWVRHPFYVTTALVMASVTLLTANGLIGLSSLLVLVLLGVRTPKEEQMLVARFGRAYQDYMARTGRFFPRTTRR